jgi:uncharacterized protein (UPF0332 family)
MVFLVSNEKGGIPMIEIAIAKSNESLDAAKLLFEKKLYNRSVASAYFACYQCALVALHQHKNEHYSINNARKHNHKSIINAFSRYLIKENNTYPDKIKSYLKELQEHRHTADYELAYSFDKTDAELILNKAIYFCTIVTAKLD